MTNEQPPVEIRIASWEDDSAALTRLRTRVFVDEQGVPRSIEWDGRDADAWHVIATLSGHVVGCGRLLPDGRIGRLAVDAGRRGTGIGRRLLDALIDVAQSQGMTEVYLHAQVSALAFYQAADFTASGDAFDEAGIAHRHMHRQLDYRNWERPLIRVAYPQPFAQLAVAQARHARRDIAILSPRLDRAVFDNADLAAALRALLRRSRGSRIRILIQDARAVVERGHGLLSLARRLPSGVEMRVLREHPEWNGASQVLRDRDALLSHPGGEGNPGSYLPGDRGRCESALTRFEDLWRSGVVDPELRALHF